MKICYTQEGNLRAQIEEDPGIGFYLYIYDESGKCIADHLQDSLKIAQIQAEQEYFIPRHAWTEWHAHTRPWVDMEIKQGGGKSIKIKGLTPQMRRALIRAKKVDKNGKIK